MTDEAPNVDLRPLQTTVVDLQTAEVVGALEGADVPSVLMKGPVLERLLYPEGSRVYVDTDLLIRQGDWDAAAAVLRRLGFADTWAKAAHPRMESAASYPWRRGIAEVDLHTTLFGIHVPSRVVWERIASHLQECLVGGRSTKALDTSACAFHVAIHATHHGDSSPKGLEDLRRAVDQLPLGVWKDAAALARELNAVPAFATGLELIPRGVDLAAELGVSGVRSVETLLSTRPVPLAQAIEDLANTPALGDKLRMIVRELFPTTTFMRWRSPLARRGRPGLAAAYILRPLELLIDLGPGFLAWRAARRRASSSP